MSIGPGKESQNGRNLIIFAHKSGQGQGLISRRCAGLVGASPPSWTPIPVRGPSATPQRSNFLYSALRRRFLAQTCPKWCIWPLGGANFFSPVLCARPKSNTRTALLFRWGRCPPQPALTGGPILLSNPGQGDY